MFVAGILSDSIVDGPGLRTTIFCQGCAHNCEGCHNPQTHEFNVGQKMSVQEVFDIIKHNPLCKGVTFSGGDPLYQSDEFCELAILLNDAGYEVACYTGFTWEELLQSHDESKLRLLRNVDVLIDGRFEISLRTLNLRFRGSSNQRIIECKKSMKLYDDGFREDLPVLCNQKRWIG